MAASKVSVEALKDLEPLTSLSDLRMIRIDDELLDIMFTWDQVAIQRSGPRSLAPRRQRPGQGGRRIPAPGAPRGRNRAQTAFFVV